MSLLSEALKEYGVEELTATGEHNPRILEYFKEATHEWVKDDELAWCSAFINAMALRNNLEMTFKLNARSWLEVGKEVEVPRPGDLVVFWRRGRNSPWGHVGIYINHDEDGIHINVLGGNQGNMVNISGYNKQRKIAYIRLEKDVETS
jgi:uncharacterized protein (TIGR02594 family)